MTVLSALQSAAIRLTGGKPGEFFSSQGPLEVELTELVNEAARDIAESYDWQRLLRTHSFGGDGTSTAFVLPEDYDRFPVNAAVHSASWSQWRYTPVNGLDQWLDLISGMGIASPGSWIMLEGQMNIWPAPATGETVRYFYVSRFYARDPEGVLKEAFTRDDDTFVLDERLLTLALIWRWRAQKRLEYAEDLANYEKAFAQETTRDRGPRIISVGPSRFPADVRPSYPGSLG